MGQTRNWTLWEEEFLREHFLSASWEFLVGNLRRSKGGIIARARKLNLGRRPFSHSLETKAHISKTLKGIPKSEQMKAKLAATRTGMRLSQAHKEAISRTKRRQGLQTFLGREHTEESRCKQSEAKRKFAEKVPPRTAEDLRGWVAIKKQVLERDGYCCLICAEPRKKYGLVVHHIISYRLVRRDDAHNCITLCRDCHGKIEMWDLWDYCAGIVETTGWRSVTRETEITKPRDGREYTWSWGGYWGWQCEDFSRCEICRKYHDPKFPYCESCGRCHKTDKKTVYHQICDRCHRPGKCKEEVLEECPR